MVLDALARAAGWLALLWQLQGYLSDVEGLDLPLKPDQHVKYTDGDWLDVKVGFSNLTNLPNDQWVSSLYLRKGNGTTSDIVSGPITYNFGTSNNYLHTYSAGLSADDDGLVLHLVVSKKSGVTAVYDQKIITLRYGENRTPHSCLAKCVINVDEWKPKAYISLNPRETIEVSADDKINIRCRAHNVPANVQTLLYINCIQVKNVSSDRIDERVDMSGPAVRQRGCGPAPAARATAHCEAFYTDSATEKVTSNTLTIHLKHETKQCKMNITTRPQLRNVTPFRSGDRFKYECSGGCRGRPATLSWRARDTNINSSTWTSSIELILDESYDNIPIKCTADYKNDMGQFVDVSITTKLILLSDSPPKRAVDFPWYIILMTTVAIMLIALAVIIYLCRRRKIRKNIWTIEVRNELYSPEYCEIASPAQYAQVYEERRAATTCGTYSNLP